MSKRHYLDCDTTPALAGRYIQGSVTLAIARAKVLIGDVTEGQIGIYDNHTGVGKFHGYVIKYAGLEPYFEQAAS